MNPDIRNGRRTLLASVLLSAPGPLVLGAGLLLGKSSTQLADFARRTAEMLALIVSLLVYTRTHREEDLPAARKEQMERNGNRFVGAIMCFSGLSMMALTLTAEQEDKGNVILPLLIAALGLLVNLFFWRKYTALARSQQSAVLDVQARLYGAKSVVDLCVTSALLTVVLLPLSPVSFWIDRVGAVLVSLYMLYCGVKTIGETCPK